MASALQAPTESLYRAAMIRAVASLQEGTPVTVVAQVGDAAGAQWPHPAREEAQAAVRLLDNGLAAAATRPGDLGPTARTQLDEILAGPEYDRARKSQELFRNIARWIQGLLDKIRPGTVSSPELLLQILQVVMVGAAVILVALILVLVVRNTRLGRSAKTQKAEDDPGQTYKLHTADEWLAEADALAAQGEHRLALRSAFLALLRRVHDQTGVEVERGQTNWEILKELRGTPQHAPMEAAIRLFESHWYAMRAATRAEYLEMRGHAEALHEGAPA